ncbi:transcriptional regulator, AraC family [Fontimonas thermophila]|uniref:Transcriptional regulator, AraC family n=1 Tax=Fontimonas thermophila TaxID=1076937 RepID=A0A1I2JGI8_9GAMM|nr:AraC family transcriptional regulator [Fontimonas thermophila]SFF53684.1 transcriptional regulator, AraC family [Fontimonas thermophila]
MPKNATALTSWAKAIRKALDAGGYDSLRLFAQAGLDIAALDDPNARYPVAGTTRLWQLAVDASGDDAFGLTVARHVGPTTFHALGYALNASATLHEVFDRMLRYFAVVTDVAELEFGEAASGYRFAMRVPDGGVIAPQAVDAFAALIVRLCRGLLGRREFSPQLVRLQRAEPRNRHAFEKVFRAPLQFCAPENALYFDRAVLDTPLEGANPELARHNDEIVQRYLARLQRDDIVTRVRTVLTDLLPHGEPSAAAVAARLHLSERSLQRRLAGAQTSFSALLRDTRHSLARSYLREPRLSIGEIAYLLGFGDMSSFTRAFRRWEGIAPSEFRTRACREL